MSHQQQVDSSSDIQSRLLMGTTRSNEQENGVSPRRQGSLSPVFKVYRERWLILAVCCFLALSNAMQWISFTTLTAQVQHYYRGNDNHENSFSAALATNQIFQIVAVFTGFGGMYITDTKGIKIAGLLGTSLNLFGATLRVIASVPYIHSFLIREILLHTGSFIAASAQAFFLVLPSKIAECWFPGDQRAIANVLSFVANPAGVALGTIIPSLVFPSNVLAIDKYSWDFFGYTMGMELLALFPFILALFVKRGLPKTPPSSSSAAHQNNIRFLKSIVACITNVQFLIQMTLFAFAFSLLWSSLIFIDLPLVKQNYILQGYPLAVCAVVGTLTSLVAGHIADKTQKFKEIIRVCTIGFATSLIILRIFLKKRNESVFDEIIIYVLCGCLGAFSIPQFPIGVELGVETTFPILEATSSGILVIFGSLLMFIVPFIQKLMQNVEGIYNDKWQFPLDVTCGLAVFSAFLSIFFLKPRYRRLELEQSRLADYSAGKDESSNEEGRDSSSFEMQ